jgi:nicotinate-nucleotide adenylyltransferase
MKIGLYFGSFNPVHNGHLIVASQLRQQAGLDKIWFVLSPQNPFKVNDNLLDENKRLSLLQKAIGGDPDFELCDVEFHLPRPSYTIDTLKFLTKKYPEHSFALLMGSDNLDGFSRWKKYDEIVKDYLILVYQRSETEQRETTLQNILLFDLPYIHISGTYIRQRVREGKTIKYLVPASIEEEIIAAYS